MIFLKFNTYLSHAYRDMLFLFCNTNLSDFYDKAKFAQRLVDQALINSNFYVATLIKGQYEKVIFCGNNAYSCIVRNRLYIIKFRKC